MPGRFTRRDLLVSSVGAASASLLANYYNRHGNSERAEALLDRASELVRKADGPESLGYANNLIARDRHIRTAVGRDYADVPPTRGVFKGTATSSLEVSVTVTPADVQAPEELPPLSDEWPEGIARAEVDLLQQHQQQQQ